jgi:hypothetical protein
MKEYQFVGRTIRACRGLKGETTPESEWMTAVVDDVSRFRGEIIMKATSLDGRSQFTRPALGADWRFV